MFHRMYDYERGMQELGIEIQDETHTHTHTYMYFYAKYTRLCVTLYSS
jgi:hypothetical protein